MRPPELQTVLDLAKRAAEYDSNDRQIETLRVALGVAVRTIDQIDADHASLVRSMCHWPADRASQSHKNFHFGDQPGQSGVCPYEAAAEVILGRPDPRPNRSVS